MSDCLEEPEEDLPQVPKGKPDSFCSRASPDWLHQRRLCHGAQMRRGEVTRGSVITERCCVLGQQHWVVAGSDT